jgi:uncharacterized membrane protein
MDQNFNSPNDNSTGVSSEFDENRKFLPLGHVVPIMSGLEWISHAWRLFKQNPALWIVITLIYIAILAVVNFFLPMVGSFVAFLFVPIFTAGIMIGCRALEKGEELEIAHLFAAFSDHFSKLLAVGGLYLGLIILLQIVLWIFIGLFLFVLGVAAEVKMIIALYAVMISLVLLFPVYKAVAFAPALVVFHDIPPVQALKSSIYATFKNIIPFLIYGIIISILGFIAIIPLGLGLLILYPIWFITDYTTYRSLFFDEE